MENDLAALDPREVARVCGVTERAARGWRQRRNWPFAIQRLLRLVCLGDMEEIGGSTWRGWRMNRRGELVGPDDEVWDSGRLGAWWIERQQLALQRKELERYQGGVPIINRAELDRLQAARDAIETAAHALGSLFPRPAQAGASQERQRPMTGSLLAM